MVAVGRQIPMFLHESKRSGTVFNIAAVVIGLLVGFPYLLCTMHFYVKPSRSSRANPEPSPLQKRLNSLD